MAENPQERNCEQCGASSPYRNGAQPFMCWPCGLHLCENCIYRHDCKPRPYTTGEVHHV